MGDKLASLEEIRQRGHSQVASGFQPGQRKGVPAAVHLEVDVRAGPCVSRSPSRQSLVPKCRRRIQPGGCPREKLRDYQKGPRVLLAGTDDPFTVSVYLDSALTRARHTY